MADSGHARTLACIAAAYIGSVAIYHFLRRSKATAKEGALRAKISEMFPRFERPQEWRTSLADVVRCFKSPVVLVSAPEFGLPVDANGEYSYKTMKICERLPGALLSEFGGCLSIAVDSLESTSGAICAKCEQQLAQGRTVPIEDGVWFQFWRGKVSGAIAQALVTTQSHNVSAAQCVEAQSIFPSAFSTDSHLSQRELVRLVVVASIDGGPVSKMEKEHTAEISRSVLEDVRRRGYEWASHTYIMWVHVPSVKDLLASLAGERRLMLDETKARCIQSDQLARDGVKVGTTFTVDTHCGALRPHADSLLRKEPDAIAADQDDLGAGRPHADSLLCEEQDSIAAAQDDGAELQSLFAAVVDGDLTTVEEILSKHPGAVNKQLGGRSKYKSQIPLTAAFRCNDGEKRVALVRLLLDKDADVNKFDAQDNCALFSAIQTSSSAATRVLVEAGANLQVSVPRRWVAAGNMGLERRVDESQNYTALSWARAIAEKSQGTTKAQKRRSMLQALDGSQK